MALSGKLFMRSWQGYFGIYFLSCKATRYKTPKLTVECINSLLWEYIQYITLFLTWHNESINDDKNNDFHTLTLCLTCTVYVLLLMSQLIADDITNALRVATILMRSRDKQYLTHYISIIYGNIHGRSCKKDGYQNIETPTKWLPVL